MYLYSKRPKMKGILVFLCAFTVCCQLSAQYTADTTYTNVHASDTLTLNIPSPPDLNFKLASCKAHISFAIGNEFLPGYSAGRFSISINYSIGESFISDAEYLIDLDQSTPEKVFIYDIISKVSDLEHLQVRINDIEVPESENSDIHDYILENLQVTISYLPEFRIDIRTDEGSNPLAPVIKRLTGNNIITNRVVTFRWDDTQTRDFPNYEFQLLRLYNQSSSTASYEKTITAGIDWSKALKIVTDSYQKYLDLAVIEGSGFYIWRVRPVGTYYEGEITDPRNYGAWSDAPADGEMLIDMSVASLYNCIFYLDDREDDLNWTYSRIFTEENRISEAMTYANGLYQVKQTQKYLPSTDTTLVTQTVMDYSGRPSLQTLPVPVEGGIDTYKSKLVTNANTLYTAEHFDTGNTITDPKTIDSSGYYGYYSGMNSNPYIPSAGGYPFARTLYENSPTGRVTEQSGVGRIHAIGSQSDGKGHTNRIIYCKPSDEELIRIFGDEALPSSAVLKTITIDANNTASVSYTSTNGKVIATCLVYNGQDDASLNDIDGYNNIENTTITEVIRDNFKTDRGFVSERTIILSFPTTLNIKYNLPENSIVEGCTRIEADCEYVVSLSVQKIGTDDIWKSPDIYLKGLHINDTTWTPRPDEFSPGSYLIRKEVRSNADRLNPSIHARIDESLDPVRNIGDVIYSWLNEVRNEKQMLLFYDDIQNFAEMVNDMQYPAIREFPFHLGEVSLPDTAYILKSSTGEVHLTLSVTPEYTPGDTAYPNMIGIYGGCCGPVMIPIIIQPQIVCYTAEEIRANPDLSPDFWGYLRKMLVEPWGDVLNIAMTDNVSGKSNIVYGYDSIALNRMVYHMLTDKYYTGATIELESTGEIVKPDSTFIGPSDLKEQYTCRELWNCWKNVINSYIDIAQNNYTEGLTSIDQGMKDDAEEGGEESPKDGYFDSESSQFGGFFFRTFLKRKLSRRMKDAENIPEDESSPGTPVDYEFKLMEQFMNCAGFRFAGIAEIDEDSLTGILPEDLDEYIHEPYYYDSPGYKFPSDSLPFAYIKNPIFAFKYFQYDGDTTITNLPSRKWLAAEVASCYDNYKEMDPPLCENRCGWRTHMNWNAYERFLFYTSIRYRKEPEETPVIEDPPDLEYQVDTMATYTFQKMYNDCESICSKKRKDIEDLVRQAFEDNCYVFNGCPADSNVVLDRDIDAIVDQLIDECVSNCRGIFEFADSAGYPKDSIPQCLQVNYAGTDWELVDGEKIWIILPDSLMLAYNVLEDWKFVFALDDQYSQCNYLDRFTLPYLSSEWTIRDEDKWNLTRVYTDSNLVVVTWSDQRNRGVYVTRDDIAGNFSITVKIDSLITGSSDATAGIMVMNTAGDITRNFVQFGINQSRQLFYATDTISRTTGATVSFPCYVKVERNGNRFDAYYYAGDHWQSFGQITADIPFNPKFGFFVNSAREGYEATGAFDDFDGGKKYPNRLNDNDQWVGNPVSAYPVYDEYGFPKKYSESTFRNVTVDPL